MVYALVPRRSLEQIVGERVRTVATAELARVDHKMLLEAQRVDDDEWRERVAGYADELIAQPGLWRDPA